VDSTKIGNKLLILPQSDSFSELFYKIESEFYKISTYSTNSGRNSTKRWKSPSNPLRIIQKNKKSRA
jgi:hypothetical protein